MPRPLAPESLDPAQVLLMLDDPTARRSLTSWLGTRNVDEMLSFAGRDPAPTDGRRRVVLLHGIMGGQLVDRRSLVDDMLWFDLPQLLYGDGLERLRLTPDGLGDAAPGVHIEPTRPLRIVYDLLAWHLAGAGGFCVHPFAYDWRRSIDIAADRLHGHLEALAAGDPSARFSVVAHSMGGAVTTRYASRHPADAARRLEQVVLLGVPLAGCFAPFELWAGIHPTAARIERVAPGLGDTIRSVFSTFPGMAELCADPTVFDSAPLLRGEAWPELPALAALLPRGAAWRASAPFPSFLLDRLDIILSGDHPTCVGLTRGPNGVEPDFAPGDGSVPALSAWREGARGHYAVPTQHQLLPLNQAVRAGVVELLATEGATAAGLRRVHRREDVPTPRAPEPNALVTAHVPADVPVTDLPTRASRGEACNGDGLWLLGCDARPGDATAGGRALPTGPRGRTRTRTDVPRPL